MEKVRTQLAKILNSETFKESSYLKRFLEYVVNETLKGNGHHIKQYTIAINAFDRDRTFDPLLDPIVRIQAGRLRQLLAAYYQTEGENDTVLIEIPVGTYIPEFSEVDRLPVKEVNQEAAKFPEIYVFPFKSLSSSKDYQFIAEGFTEELITNLSFFTNMTTIRATADIEEKGFAASADLNIPTFSLKGSIRFAHSKIKVVVTLYSAANNHIIWSMEFLEPYELENVVELQELVARKVATSVADDFGGAIVKKIYAETQKMAYVDIERFNIILILYVYLRNPSHIEYNKIVDLFYTAVRKFPDFGPGWAGLSLILFNNYILGYTPNRPELLEEASRYALKGKECNPNNQLCRATYGYSFLINNKLENCLMQEQYAKSLNPRSAYYLGVIGFISSLAGDWEQGLQDISTSLKLNPDGPRWYHIPTTLFYLKEKDFKMALEEALKVDLPLILWDYVLKAVAYAYTGNLPEAQLQLKRLAEVLPDFFDKPTFYLKMYIKFDDILETVLAGLAKAGFKGGVVPE